MNTMLALTDPLAGQEVTILLTLAAADAPLAERPLLLSLGVSDQLPVVQTGTFGELAALIHAAWTAFGVRAQLDEAAADGAPAVGADVIATAAAANDEPPPVPTPRPQARNLSLF